VLHGDNFNDTIAKVSEIVEMEGRIFIPPYDDAKVIAGQGTIGLEIWKIFMTWIMSLCRSAAAV
jgi:threonine dehydratase